uniref:Chromosome 3 open reading frame 38 n=1 Tax=Tetraodon nigroviridis TaxID=99883 RepID=H3CFH5_TETNG
FTMSELSQTERTGCTDILNLMTDSSVLSLCDTITNKQIVVENVAEATKTIIAYTKDAEEFLRRKKVHREVIFKYLAQKGVTPPNSEKNTLVRRTLKLWSSGKVTGEIFQEPNGSNRSRATETLASEQMPIEGDFNHWLLGTVLPVVLPTLNSQNPSLGHQPLDWGPQHFWPDVKLRLFSCAGNEEKEEFIGGEQVSLRLLALTKDERLCLSPNLEPRGLDVLASRHGLVRVAVAGTIHRDGLCLGIFEQIFGLISTHSEKEWKIKFINMNIRGQDASGGKTVAAPSLSSNSEELQ